MCSQPEKAEEPKGEVEETAANHSQQSFAVHPKVKQASSYINLDAEFVSLNAVDDRMRMLEKLVGYLFDNLEKSEELQNASSLRLPWEKITELTKLSSLKALGSSSHPDGELWENRVFIDNLGEKGGIFSLFNDASSEWRVLEFAPAEADIVFEADLKIGAVAQLLEQMLTELNPQNKKKVNQLIGEDGLEVLEKIRALSSSHAKVSAIIELDKEHQIQLGRRGPSVNPLHAVVRIDGAYTMVKELLPKLEDKMTVSEKDGFKMYTMDQIQLPDSGNNPEIAPCVWVDQLKDEIWLASSEAYLQSCMSGDKKLADTKTLKSLITEENRGGNVLTFCSHDLLTYINELYSGEIGAELKHELITKNHNDQEREMMRLLFKLVDKTVIPRLLSSKEGYLATYTFQEDGIIMLSKTPFPLRGATAAFLPIAAPFIAALSVKVVPKQIARANATAALSNAKDIYVGLRDYAFNNDGMTPVAEGKNLTANDHLRLAIERGSIPDEKPFYAKGVNWARPGDENTEGKEALSPGENIYGYLPGFNIPDDPADSPLLIAPLMEKGGEIMIDVKAFGGQVVIITMDGAGYVQQVGNNGEIVDFGYFEDDYLHYKIGENWKKARVALPAKP